MTGNHSPRDGAHDVPRPGDSPGGAPRQPANGTGENASWSVFSYLIAGMVAYGAIGWLIGHWTHHPIVFPIGMVVGLAISIGLIIHRFGRS